MMVNKCGCEVVHVLLFEDKAKQNEITQIQVRKWVIVRATTKSKWLWRNSEVMKESDTVLLISYLCIL